MKISPDFAAVVALLIFGVLFSDVFVGSCVLARMAGMRKRAHCFSIISVIFLFTLESAYMRSYMPFTIAALILPLP